MKAIMIVQKSKTSANFSTTIQTNQRSMAEVLFKKMCKMPLDVSQNGIHQIIKSAPGKLMRDQGF